MVAEAIPNSVVQILQRCVGMATHARVQGRPRVAPKSWAQFFVLLADIEKPACCRPNLAVKGRPSSSDAVQRLAYVDNRISRIDVFVARGQF